jgi:hypothetical protein
LNERSRLGPLPLVLGQNLSIGAALAAPMSFCALVALCVAERGAKREQVGEKVAKRAVWHHLW